MNKKEIQIIKEWLEEILMVEYKKNRKSELRLENIMEIFKDDN